MPNRVIKESIKRSTQIDSLTWFEEVVFYRLMVTADDYGCLDGRPVLLKNELFPTREDVTKKAVENAIHKLVSVGLLLQYEVSGMPYLLFPTWEKHQRIRNKHRKYPAPPDDCHLTADCCQTSANRQSESESNPNPNPNPNPKHARGAAFDRFWSVYPKKVGKEAARKAFLKADADLSVMLRAIEAQKQSRQWQEDGGKYIPNPATWLNQGRWEDEITASPGQTSADAPGGLELRMLRKLHGGD